MTRAPVPPRPSPPASAPVRFPYMFWAHTEAFRTARPLSQSGMPTADAGLFAELQGIDLGHPSAVALPELERALGRYLDVEPERVLVTLGASGGMHLAALRWFRPGTRVVTDVPSYEPFRALPEHLGATTIVVERRLESGWRLDPADVERRLANANDPAHLFFANPHNPTGAMTGATELAELGRVVERRDGVLIACEVYMEYVPRAERVHAFRVARNGVSIGSFTKAYGLGPLRMGWIVLGEALAHEARALRDMAYIAYVDPPTIAMQAARVALAKMSELERPVAANRASVRPIFDRWLARCDAIESTIPAHGIIAFPRVKGVRDTRALCEHLVAEHGVDVVPGEFFGLAGHVRVGCGVPREHLEDGLARLERGIASFRARG